ncbi:hypothetical protein O7626_17705 [Micromonospora sp. WMMD1102]|uniref:hypothetical protein n=1 Tax=Micromonospora sp. WMMD1102 TaxID=3016105 RepID=UPI0024155A32|nr:hypothetical protein [Micromonospora sp. WMMD1102]MDG4787751.1 hypothetical protein [Micromonospora sp. WMMD1102]
MPKAAAREGDLPDGVDPRALARFVMALSEGHAVHAAAGATRAELQASVDVALRAVALRPSPAGTSALLTPGSR